MYVCLCQAVRDAEVRQAVASGVEDVEQLAEELGVGTGCGSCREFRADADRRIREPAGTVSRGVTASLRRYNRHHENPCHGHERPDRRPDTSRIGTAGHPFGPQSKRRRRRPDHRADLADYDAIRPAFDGQDVVVHLAAKAGENFTWDELLQTNIVGTRNVLAAAKDAGCKRVVFASSGATVSGWELVEPYKAIVEARYADAPDEWPMIRHDMATRPTGVYGSTKVWGEAISRHVADTSAYR